MATVIGADGVLSLVPLLGVLLIRKEWIFPSHQGRRYRAELRISAPDRPADGEPSGPLEPDGAGGGGLSFIYATLEPRYRLADQVPDKR